MTSTASAAAASTATTTMHSPTHWRLRQALRRQRCTARPLCTRPAWPRRALRSHDYQRAPRKLSVPPTILPRRYATAASVQSLAPHTSGPRDVPRCGALSLLQRRRTTRGGPAETAARLNAKLWTSVTGGACFFTAFHHPILFRIYLSLQEQF